MDIDTDTGDTDVSEFNVVSRFNKTAIKNKIQNGELKLIKEMGRNSKLWSIFFKIKKSNGEEICDVVFCSICKNVYSYNEKCASNLIRHSCYKNAVPSIVKTKVDAETKLKGIRAITKWTIKSCRPFNIVEDIGFQETMDFFVSVGGIHGEHVDTKTLIPQPTTLAINTTKMYNIYFQKVKNEIATIRNIGYSLTSKIWKDSYYKRIYIGLTIHYINEGTLVNRLLGMKSIKGEKCTSSNIKSKVTTILDLFDLDMEDKPIVVTDRGPSMLTAFRTDKHISCIEYLLKNTIQKSMTEIPEISELNEHCTNLVKYLKTSGLNTNLVTSFNSCSPNRWNSTYTLFVALKRNWSEVNQQLEQNNAMELINNINLNCIKGLVKVLEVFDDTIKKLEDEKYATIHLVIIYIYRLKKLCNNSDNDLDLIKQFKEKLRFYLKTLVEENLSIYHKIALYLFPPVNNLKLFDESEKKYIKSECKKLMQFFLEYQKPENENLDNSTISSQNIEIYADFLQQSTSSDDRTDSIKREILTYELLNVTFHDDFDILNWWNLHSKEFPLLFKVSCMILSTPASTAPCERAYSKAGNIINEKSSKQNLNEIMFLHINTNDEEMDEILNANFDDLN